MRLLWILVPGVYYLILLLCSVLAATGSTISPRTAGALSGGTSQAFETSTAAAAEKANSARSPAWLTSISNGMTMQPVSVTISPAATEWSSFTGTLTSDNGRISTTTSVTPLATSSNQPPSPSNTITLLTDSITTTSTGVTAGTGTTIPGTKTTHHPGKQLLKFWEIILISLAVTAAIIAGFIGCCYFCRTSNTSYSITSLP